MAHVCTHSSESWVWKGHVSGRQWLNDSTYCPNSHSGSCAYLKKKNNNNNMQGSPTNRELVVSVRLEGRTLLGFMFDLLWRFLWVKIEFCLSFYPRDIIWHVFTVVTCKVTLFKNSSFQLNFQLLSYFWSKLGPKMVTVKKGVFWLESHKGEKGGERLKQDRAEPRTSFHSCVFIQSHCASQEMPSAVSMKMSFLLW